METVGASLRCWVAVVWNNMPSCWCVFDRLFFAISGANEIVCRRRHRNVVLRNARCKSKATFPHQMAYFVSGVEFVGGSSTDRGVSSSPACVALLIDMTVAVLTDALSTMPKGLSPLNWLDDFLYLPEVLYVLVLYLADLFRSGKVQCRLLARRQVTR